MGCRVGPLYFVWNGKEEMGDRENGGLVMIGNEQKKANKENEGLVMIGNEQKKENKENGGFRKGNGGKREYRIGNQRIVDSEE